MTITIDQIKTEVQTAPSLYGRPIAVSPGGDAAIVEWAVKPSNPFGYWNSSAPPPNALTQAGCDAPTPACNPRPDVDADWTYPDSSKDHPGRRRWSRDPLG